MQVDRTLEGFLFNLFYNIMSYSAKQDVPDDQILDILNYMPE